MNEFSLAKLQETLREKGCSAAILTNPATITWLTGYAPPIQTGPSPFEGGTAIGFWVDGQFTLLLSDMESPAAQALGISTRDYVSYTIEEPVYGFEHQAQVFRELIEPLKNPKDKVAVELNYLSASLYPFLLDAIPHHQWVILDNDLPLLRAVKSPAEVEKIRASLAIADSAQTITKRLLQVGLSEIELWGQVKAGLEHQLGGRLPLLADFVGGARTAEIGGLPGVYRLQAGDAFIADIVPRLDGYWGDNAATHFVGEPSALYQKVYNVVLEALEKGLEAVKPGVKARDLDAMLRQFIEGQGYPVYPHHSGHGIGVTYHEEPRIVPYNELTLQPGMVLALEPGIYLPDEGLGVRLEDVVLVTQDGCEVLTHHLGH
ncbi:MAG: Xaa-Pro peptidase family protein [Anaerolineales bacterium]|nr:Xaa-Pro peptidase family protein [Anaerolineales bacterium]